MSFRRFANGLLVRLFSVARARGQLEFARLDLLCGLDGNRSRLGGAGLSAAGEVDAERDLPALFLGRLVELRFLAQGVDVGTGAVVALGREALVELRARVGGG